MPVRRPVLRALLFVVISAAATIALIEALLSALLAFPARSPLLPLVQDLYFHVERDIIQFNPSAARWDPELFYTLRPGRFVFAQREFRHEFRVNRAGVRDDEATLDAPQIIALGDSFTMGWGVIATTRHPRARRMTGMGFPLHLPASPARLRRHAPQLGAHTREILTELKYRSAEIRRLLDTKIVRVT